MATEQNTPEIDLGQLTREVLNDLRTLADPQAKARRKEGSTGLSRLGQIAGQVQAKRTEATQQLETTYRERTAELKDVASRKQQRLQAYAQRERHVVPAAPGKYVVAGRVTDQATGVGLPNVRVRAFDLDIVADDPLGDSYTDALGYFRIDYEFADFADLIDRTPEAYVEVLDDQGAVIFRSPRSLVDKTGPAVFISAHVGSDRVPESRALGSKIHESVERRIERLEQRRRVLDEGSRISLTKEVSTPAEAAKASPSVDLQKTFVLAREVTKTPPSTPTRAIGRPERPETPAYEPPSRPAAVLEVEKAAGTGRAKRIPGAPAVTEVSGIGKTFSARLTRFGITSAVEMGSMPAEQLAHVLHVSVSRAESLIRAAKSIAGKRRRKG